MKMHTDRLSCRTNAEAQRHRDEGLFDFAFLSAPLRLCVEEAWRETTLARQGSEGFDRAHLGAGKRRLKTCAYGPRRQWTREPEASIAASFDEH
jgi:hypothetical protein